MNLQTAGLILAVGFSYFVLTVIMPAVFLYRYIKEQRFVVRFAVYQVAGHVYMLFFGFLFSFLKIWSTDLFFLVLIVLPLLAKLLIFRQDLIELLLNYLRDKRAKLVTARGTIRNIRLWAQKKLKDAYYRYIRYHYLEIILLILLFLYIAWFYGYFKIHNFTYASSDEATHLYWMNALFAGYPFPVGMYPHSMHFMLAAIHSITGIQTILINHYFSITIVIAIHFAIFCTVKALFKSAPAAIGSTGLFLLANMFVAQRYQNTLPMEYGMIAMFLMIILLTEFIKKRNAFYLWMAALATGWTFHIHFYITIVCAFLWIGFLLVYLKTMIRLKLILKTLAIIGLAAVLAIAPFGIGVAAGWKFEQSIDWALSVMGVDSEEAIISTAEQNHKEEEEPESVSGGKEEDGASSADGEEKDVSGEKEKAEKEKEEKAPNPYLLELKMAKHPDEYMRALAHPLMVKLIGGEPNARMIYYLIFFGLFYGIGMLIVKNLRFRKRKKEILEEGAGKKEYRRRKQEYLVKDGIVLAVPVMILFAILCYSMSFYGLPELIDAPRAAMIVSPLLALCFAAPIAFVHDLFNLIPLKKKRILEFLLLLGVGAGIGTFYVKGPVKQLSDIGCYAVTQQLSNELSYDLIGNHKRNTWTVISPVNDLLAIHHYGYHYEVIDMLMEIENGETDIAMPTNDLYVVVEKKIMNAAGVFYLPDYHRDLKAQSKPIDRALIDENYYDLGLPWKPAEEAYSTFRDVTMSKLYYWMEEMKAAYPNEVEVYGEDDLCVIYHIRQSADFPINLARDYREENYGVPAEEDFERRYAEEHGTEYEADKR